MKKISQPKESVKKLNLSTNSRPAIVGKSKLESKNITLKVTVGSPNPEKPNLAKMSPKEFAKFRNSQVYKSK